MIDDLRPSRSVAVFPFAMLASSASARDAAICRGFACYLERTLSALNGIEASLQHLFVAPEGDSERKGWLMTNTLWTLDQLLGLPYAKKDTLTHVIQGAVRWAEHEELELIIELVDFQNRESLLKETISGPPDEVLAKFYQLLGNLVFRLTGSRTAARVSARRPTESAEAFENYIMALAAEQAYAHKMMGLEPALAFLHEAIVQDSGFRLACETLEVFIHEGLNGGEAAAKAATEALNRAEQTAAAGYPRFQAMLGLQLVKSGEPGRGRHLLEQFLHEEVHGYMAARVMTVLARMNQSKGEKVAARELLEKAVRADPENVIAWEQLGNALWDEGQSARAEHAWRQALHQNSDAPGPLLHLGMAHYAREDFRGALQLFERALKIAGHDNRLMPLVIDAYLRVDDLKQADKVATAWVEQEGENIQAWYGIGRVRRARGDIPAARHCAGKIAELATREDEIEAGQLLTFQIEDPEGFERFANYRKQLDETEGKQADGLDENALADLASLAEEHRHAIAVWRVLARARLRENDPKGAVQAQRHVVGFHPGAVPDLLRMATYQLGADLPNDAIETLARALSLADKTDHWPLVLLGEAHLELNQLPKARDAFRQALQRNPDNELLKRKVQRVDRLIEDRARRTPLKREGTETAPGILRRLRRKMGLD